MKNEKKTYYVDLYGKSSTGMTNHTTKSIYDAKTKEEAKKKAYERCSKQFGLIKSKTKVK